MRTIPVHRQGCFNVIISSAKLALICIDQNFKCGEQTNAFVQHGLSPSWTDWS
jgi:hypothetical protein